MKSYYPTIFSLLGSPNGKLIEIGSCDADFLIAARNDYHWEAYGCDIHEHAGVEKSRPKKVNAKLIQSGIPTEAYKWFSTSEPLPYSDNSASVVVSIQTLEHVKDIDLLFQEVQRILRPGGIALHFFPPAEIFIDPHCGIPLAHHCSKDRKQWIKTFSRLGLGKYRSYAKNQGYTLDSFAERFDGYLKDYCHYRRLKEYLDCSSKHGLYAHFFAPPPLPQWAWLTQLTARFTSIYLKQEKPVTKD